MIYERYTWLKRLQTVRCKMGCHLSPCPAGAGTYGVVVEPDGGEVVGRGGFRPQVRRHLRSPGVTQPSLQGRACYVFEGEG